ncbi:MerR family transcriptional regulator [uncultured Sphaerochaeta sp.]|uniref:MerR family transcriptional regulator n=1 Tax=uncultured Sphaerochaeta sp. TaxID=886478 RepID=UPI002A0A521D|nr:MerR family transcriptional regulator [uncultured Sphaerochaeta sp.]
MKEIFSIGEFSELFHVDVQTLRYYDSIGLLVPSSRDTKTGYRHYRFDQVYQLASIRYLRRLGYSLKQISEYLNSRTLDNSMESLRQQAEALRAQWNELYTIDLAISRKLEFIEEQSVASLDVRNIFLKTFGERIYLNIGLEEILYASESFYLYPTVVFYTQQGKQFGAYMFNYQDSDEKGTNRFGAELSVIPEGRFLCGYHQGAYESIGQSFSRIRQTGKALDLNLSPDYMNFNIIDQFVERDSMNFITEIQIRILD